MQKGTTAVSSEIGKMQIQWPTEKTKSDYILEKNDMDFISRDKLDYYSSAEGRLCPCLL
jgi:hypothetical protein